MTKPKRPNVKRPQSRLDALLLAGAMCSNVCYNLSQKGKALTDADREPLRRAYIAWDEAVRS